MSKENSTRIRVLLLKKGITQTKIARQQGVTVGAINAVIFGRRKNSRLREAIACACGVRVDDLWPTQAA